jgi:hypothetical protein
VLKRIIDAEYADILADSIISRGKLRAFVDDSSFIDVWFSLKIAGRFSYHWERRHIDGSMYAMIIFQIQTGKGYLPIPSTSIMVLRMRLRRAI